MPSTAARSAACAPTASPSTWTTSGSSNTRPTPSRRAPPWPARRIRCNQPAARLTPSTTHGSTSSRSATSRSGAPAEGSVGGGPGREPGEKPGGHQAHGAGIGGRVLAPFEPLHAARSGARAVRGHGPVVRHRDVDGGEAEDGAGGRRGEAVGQSGLLSVEGHGLAGGGGQHGGAPQIQGECV